MPKYKEIEQCPCYPRFNETNERRYSHHDITAGAIYGDHEALVHVKLAVTRVVNIEETAAQMSAEEFSAK